MFEDASATASSSTIRGPAAPYHERRTTTPASDTTTASGTSSSSISSTIRGPATPYSHEHTSGTTATACSGIIGGQAGTYLERRSGTTATACSSTIRGPAATRHRPNPRQFGRKGEDGDPRQFFGDTLCCWEYEARRAREEGGTAVGKLPFEALQVVVDG
jgi:hypothetical protein